MHSDSSASLVPLTPDRRWEAPRIVARFAPGARLATAEGMGIRRAFQEYQGDQDLPLGSYAGLVGVFGACLGTLMIVGRKRMPKRFGIEDLALMGLATHKLARIVTKDWVTSPMRAPFTRYEAPRPGGEVSESARGSGPRKAIADLVTCNYCVGPWVAGGLTALYMASRRAARTVMSIFATTAISDFLHHFYSLLEARTSESREISESTGVLREEHPSTH